MRRLANRKFIASISFLLSLIVLVGLSIDSSVAHAEIKWKVLPEKKNVPLNKEWIVTFNSNVEISSITRERIYIKDDAGKMLKTTAMLINNGKKIKISPPEGGYLSNSSYTLYIENEVASTNRKLLGSPVKMPFKTGDHIDKKDEFIPRKGSENAVTYQEGVTNLPEDVLQSLREVDYEKNRFVFHDSSTIIEGLVIGDIVIFPATERHPLGWSKKIIDILSEDKRVILITEEPELEEVVKYIDMSRVLPITAADFTLDAELRERVVSETEVGDTRTLKLENSSDKSIAEIEFGSENGDPYIKMSNFKVLPEGKDHGPATLGGKIQLKKPVVNLDMKGLTVNWLEVDTAFHSKLKIDFEMSGYEEEPVKIPIHAPIDLKAYGIAGVELQFFLHYQMNGKIFIGFEIIEDDYYNVGVKKEASNYIPFNHSTTAFSSNLLSMKAEAEGKIGVGLNIDVAIIQFIIGGIDVKGGYKMEVAGEIDKDDMCFSLKDEFYAESSAKIRVVKKTYLDVVIPFGSYPLNQKSTCSYKELLIEPLVLHPSETVDLEISGLDSKGELRRLALPDSNLTFKIEDTQIATVNYLGEIRAKTTAKDGGETTLTVTYDDGRDAIKEVRIPVKVVTPLAENRLKEMTENIGPAIRSVFEKAEIVGDSYREFSYIENDLRKLVTPNYLKGLREYYESFMHPTIDLFLFAEPVSIKLKFEVIERSATKYIVKTVIPNRGLSSGANQLYTFVKEGESWLLDEISEESFEKSPINPTVDQALNYLRDSYFENNDDQISFVSSGTEKIYHQPENKYYIRDYYIFHIKTAWDEYHIKFSAHDGSIVAL